MFLMRERVRGPGWGVHRLPVRLLSLQPSQHIRMPGVQPRLLLPGWAVLALRRQLHQLQRVRLHHLRQGLPEDGVRLMRPHLPVPLPHLQPPAHRSLRVVLGRLRVRQDGGAEAKPDCLAAHPSRLLLCPAGGWNLLRA